MFGPGARIVVTCVLAPGSSIDIVTTPAGTAINEKMVWLLIDLKERIIAIWLMQKHHGSPAIRRAKGRDPSQM